ncbi:MAG TPA: hypothetical protein VF172_01000 [Nitrososphaera sp.]|jgi:hypothetical protein
MVSDKSRKKATRSGLAIAGALAAFFSVVSTVPAYATHYWSGWYWDEDNHSEEFDNGEVPFAFDTFDLGFNLPRASGTSITDIYTCMNNAIDEWDAETDAAAKRKDNTSFFHDNVIGTADLADGQIAVTNLFTHGSDDHLIRAPIDFNSDDYIWDCGDDDAGSQTVDTYAVLLHELGHALVGLCDTYPDHEEFGDCTDFTTTGSIMWSYEYGDSVFLHAHDIDTADTVY